MHCLKVKIDFKVKTDFWFKQVKTHFKVVKMGILVYFCKKNRFSVKIKRKTIYEMDALDFGI